MRNPSVSALTLTVLLVASTLLVLGSPNGGGAGGRPAPVPITGPSPAPRVPGQPVVVAPGYSLGPDVRDLGEVGSSTALDLVVGVAPQDPAGLAAYLTALYAPGSPVYHRYRSVTSLADQFGASISTTTAALSYFDSYGLRTTLSPDRLLLTVDGPASEVGPAFGTSFHDYVRDDGTQFISHPTAAELPGDVPWTGVYGLGNATPLSPAVASSTGSVALAGPAAGCSGSATYEPCQLRNTYNFTGVLDDGANGSGETIAVVDAYDAQNTENDLAASLAAFDHMYGLAVPTVHYLYPVPSDHNLNKTYTGWGTEEALDLEWSHTSAPGAAIDMTFAPDPDAGLYEAVDYLVAHEPANVISLSWGEPDVGVYNAYEGPCPAACNASTDGTYGVLAPVLQFAAAEGISVFAASGDCGAADGTSGLSTNFPASDPYVTGVGGTDVNWTTNGSWAGESGWSGNESGAKSPGCENGGGSGGGYSPFPRPWWQTGEGLAPSNPYRGVPDVSADSMPGVVIAIGGSYEGVGGTSLATPVWAGITADADEFAGVPLGFLNPELYSLMRSPTNYANDFHDIRSGNNTYHAGRGWDPVTGIGSPNVGALLPQLASVTVTATNLSTHLNASATSGRAPLTVTFSVNASGGSGSYPLEGVYFGDGNAAFAVDGVVNHTYTAAGVYSAQSYVIDNSSNLSTSTPVALVVGGGDALSVSLASSTTTPTVGTNVTFTTIVTGGTAPYSYRYAFGDGTYENWTSGASVDHLFAVSGSFCAEVVVKDSHTPPDGGASLAVPIAVGSATLPACGPPATPLEVTANSTTGVRDAPADFPDLFQVSGGSGTTSEQYQSTDAYVAACGCTILRTPGRTAVWVYANDSAGQSVVGETNVTVAPALDATFTASPTMGLAPLQVNFSAEVAGGYDANAADTNWSFGNGAFGVGSSVSETYSVPGTYWAVGHLSDLGEGNASEAFLIDVGAPAVSPAYLSASIDPAVDVTSGGTVHFTAGAWTGPGTPTDAALSWGLGGTTMAYSTQVNRTFYAPGTDAGQYDVAGNLSAFFGTQQKDLTVPFALGSFFAEEAGGFVPAADALVLSDLASPSSGVPPVNWTGVANDTTGPGNLSFAWEFGDGTGANGSVASHQFSVPGEYTATVTVNDSWGDVAVDAHGVNVTNGSVEPLRVVVHASVSSGPAPLRVSFVANASGGTGAPFAFLWQLGDGNVSSGAGVSHTYERVGTYLVNVTARDSGGAVDANGFVIVVSAPVSASGGPPGSSSLAELALLSGLLVGALLAVVTRRRSGSPRRSTSP